MNKIKTPTAFEFESVLFSQSKCFSMWKSLKCKSIQILWMHQWKLCCFVSTQVWFFFFKFLIVGIFFYIFFVYSTLHYNIDYSVDIFWWCILTSNAATQNLKYTKRKTKTNKKLENRWNTKINEIEISAWHIMDNVIEEERKWLILHITHNSKRWYKRNTNISIVAEEKLIMKNM